LTPERIAKIRAIANDPRADPGTRAIAKAMLAKFAAPPETAAEFLRNLRNPRHPGMRTTPEYDQWRRMMKKTNRGMSSPTSKR
jgi:hypothetical protein